MSVRSLPVLEKFRYEKLDKYPKISVIVTACNEEKTIEKAMRSRLNDSYENIEFIVVNDRSTDKTQEIVESLSKTDERIKVVNIEILPDGWLGKLHAMQKGVEIANGEWLLFSDADVFIAASALQQVIIFAENGSIDHVAVLPDLKSDLFLNNCATSTVLREILLLTRPWTIGRPGAKQAAGSGAFNLVRKPVFDRTNGFHDMKMEVVDDTVLAQLLLEQGGKPAVVIGRSKIGLTWYHSFSELLEGLGRLAFAGLGSFSGKRLAAIASIPFFFDMLPYFALFLSDSILIKAISVFTVTLSFIVINLLNVYLKRPLIPTIFPPLNHLLAYFICLHSAITNGIRGGIIWRGTFYPSELLKKGQMFDPLGIRKVI
jgi:glycosyltransferase involved in cell wall biosynthesis